jgi:hypothetical protein
MTTQNNNECKRCGLLKSTVEVMSPEKTPLMCISGHDFGEGNNVEGWEERYDKGFDALFGDSGKWRINSESVRKYSKEFIASHTANTITPGDLIRLVDKEKESWTADIVGKLEKWVTETQGDALIDNLYGDAKIEVFTKNTILTAINIIKTNQK